MATHLHRQAALWHQQQADTMGALLRFFREMREASGGRVSLDEYAAEVIELEELRPHLEAHGGRIDHLPLDWREKVHEAQADEDRAAALEAEQTAAIAAAVPPLTAVQVAGWLKGMTPEQRAALQESLGEDAANDADIAPPGEHQAGADPAGPGAGGS
jgi:hypothetical protein